VPPVASEAIRVGSVDLIVVLDARDQSVIRSDQLFGTLGKVNGQ
jgi:hypothetical protein